jgi:hypothetical protein
MEIHREVKTLETGLGGYQVISRLSLYSNYRGIGFIALLV